MAEKTIKARIRCKIDTAENWKTNNPVLLVGELGVESDTQLIKVGDGTTSWTSLSYLQYLPLSGGQLTGAVKIADGYDKGIQDIEGNNLLYMDDKGVLNIRNESWDDIHLGSNGGGEIEIGGSRILSYINVVGRSFTYNDKGVAVTDDIPKTLNGKTLVANGDTTIYGTDITLASDNVGNLTDAIIGANVRIDNLTTTVDGKADTSAIPTKTSQLTNDSGYINKDVSNLTNYLPLSGGTLTGTPMVKDNTILTFVNSEGTPFYLLSYSDALKCFEIGNYGVPVHLIGSETRPKYETPTTEDGGVDLALLSDVPSVEQSTGSSTTATISQNAITNNLNGKVNYSDILQATGTNTNKVMSQNATTTELNKKANLSGGNVFTGTQTMNNALAVSSILTNGAGNTMYIGTGNAGLKYYNINNTSNMWNVVVDSDGNLIFQKG